MDLTNEIKEIADYTSKVLEKADVSILDLEWILAQVQQKICASTKIKTPVAGTTDVCINIGGKELARSCFQNLTTRDKILKDE